MAVQPGDIITCAKLAWDIFDKGWNHELRASFQYAQFGTELRHLANNLKLLSSVISKAQESLRSHSVHNSGQVRWDQHSFFDIVGDFYATLRECENLLEDNRKLGTGPNSPLRNLEWNLLVQPTADRLSERIQMHHSRIQSVLKPFEIDLLTRIHEDLAARIGAVRDDVQQVHATLHELIGVLVPDLKTALDQREALRIRLLPVPPEIEQALEGVFSQHLACKDGQQPPLRDVAGAFIQRLELSTKYFKPGMTVAEQTPPLEQYLNLLKCLFLLKKMEMADEFVNAPAQSHWASYVKALKERVSLECDNFNRGRMVAPSSALLANVNEEDLTFWVKETRPDLIDTVIPNIMMEELVEMPLYTDSPNISKQIRLLRHAKTHDEKFRLVISATERQTTGSRSRQQKEVVDFDVKTATINPLYALSSGSHRAPYEMILEANNKIHRLAFSDLEDAFHFQRGITGFKVADNCFIPLEKVSFVIKDQGLSYLDASAQFWIHRRLEGSPMPDNSYSPSSIDTPSSPIPIAGGPRIVSSPEFGGQNHFGSPEIMSAEFNPGGLSSSPGRMSTRLSRSPDTPPMASTARLSPSPNRSQTLAPAGLLSTSPGQDSTSSGSFMSKFRRSTKPSTKPSKEKHRNMSVSTNATTATTMSMQSNASSSTSETTVTIGGGTQTKTVMVHTKPKTPMLVIFTRDPNTGHRAIVAVSVDEKTTSNPHKGTGGAPLTVLLQDNGKKALEAKRLYSQKGQWDLLPLCMSRRNDRGFAGAALSNLSRVSILFQDEHAYLRFAGIPCMCRRRTIGDENECIRKMHVGLLGEVRIRYRKELKRYWELRHGPHDHVSNKSLAGGAPG